MTSAGRDFIARIRELASADRTTEAVLIDRLYPDGTQESSTRWVAAVMARDRTSLPAAFGCANGGLTGPKRATPHLCP
jgi:hypothetical protein